MASIFSKIISGEIPAYKVAENEDFIAFLDVMPIREGHTLVVPKIEIDKIFDVDTKLLSKWLPFAQPIARAIEAAFPCKRCGLTVIGLEVPHAHMHLVPIDRANDLNFNGTRPKAPDELLKAAQDKLLKALSI